VETLAENVHSLSEQDLSDYLLKQANGGAGAIDDTIFMTAVLTSEEYADFKSTAAHLEAQGLATLMETTDVLSGQRRSQFLQAGAASQDSATEFLAMFNSQSSATRADYLDTSSRLKGENLDNFVRASVNAGGELGNFIEITNELMAEIAYLPDSNVEIQTSTLQMFLSLSEEADSKDLQGFINLLGKLDTDPGTTGIENYYDNTKGINGLRASFIQVAYKSGLELGDLNRLGNDTLTLGEERFQDIFGMDNLVAKNTNLSVKDYENLIRSAKIQDGTTWGDTRFSTFYRDYPEIDQLV